MDSNILNPITDGTDGKQLYKAISGNSARVDSIIKSIAQ